MNDGPECLGCGTVTVIWLGFTFLAGFSFDGVRSCMGWGMAVANEQIKESNKLLLVAFMLMRYDYQGVNFSRVPVQSLPRLMRWPLFLKSHPHRHYL